MYKNTFIMPSWNNPDLTEKAIRSCLKQPDSFVVVLDNEFTHKELFKKLTKENIKNLSLVSSEANTGWVGGVNQLMQFINKIPDFKSEYITLINNDVELPDDFWEKIEPHFTEDVGAVGPVGNNVSGLHDHNLKDFPEHHKVNCLIGYCLTMKREAFKKVGDELDPIFGWGLSDDLDLSHRLTLAGYDLIIARDCQVFHHGSKAVQLLHKTDEEYSKDLQEKNQIFINKWGEDIFKQITSVEAPVSGTIAVPHLEMIHADFFTRFRALQRPNNVYEAFVKGTLITKARNDLVKASKGDWILFCDADMVFEPDALKRLLAHNLDIVGGLCFRRVPDYNPTLYKKIAGQLKWNWMPNYPRDSLFEVDATGSAFLLIKRKVFDKIAYPWYEYDGDISEDLLFCNKAKEAGFKIHIDSSVKIGHLGMMSVDEKFYDNYMKDKQMVQ